MIILNSIPKFGDKSDDVKKLQERLLELGFSPGEIDGILGSNTATAISNLQKANGLPGSGTIGNKTMAILGFSATNQFPYNLSFLSNVTIDMPLTDAEGIAFYNGMIALCQNKEQVKDAKIEAHVEAPANAECATTCSAFLEYAFTNAHMPRQADLFKNHRNFYATHEIEKMLYRLGFKYYLKEKFVSKRGAVGTMNRGPFYNVTDHTYHIYIILDEVDNKYDTKMDNGQYGIIYTEKGVNVQTKGFWLPPAINSLNRI